MRRRALLAADVAACCSPRRRTPAPAPSPPSTSSRPTPAPTVLRAGGTRRRRGDRRRRGGVRRARRRRAASAAAASPSCTRPTGRDCRARLPRARARRGATPERFRRRRHAATRRCTRRGGLAVGVPGEVAGWVALHAALRPAPARRASSRRRSASRATASPRGDAPHLRTRDRAQRADLLRADPGLRAIFLGRRRAAPGPDFRVVQPRPGADARGDRARRRAAPSTAAPRRAAIAAAVAGARRRPHDRTTSPPTVRVWRTPLVGDRSGAATIVTFPPPGSGGVVLEIARPARARRPAGARRRHRRHCCTCSPAPWRRASPTAPAGTAIRDVHDRPRRPPARSRPPRRAPRAACAPDARDRARRRRSSPTPAPPTSRSSTPPATPPPSRRPSTPASAPASWCPGTGIILNNEMDDFAVAPDVPNVYGLVGGAANAIAPGKRPQSSMSPTIVLRGARARAGGRRLGRSDDHLGRRSRSCSASSAFGRDLRAAVAAPRIHDQGAPPVARRRAGHRAETRARCSSASGTRVREVPVHRRRLGRRPRRRTAPRSPPATRRKDGGEPTVLRLPARDVRTRRRAGSSGRAGRRSRGARPARRRAPRAARRSAARSPAGRPAARTAPSGSRPAGQLLVDRLAPRPARAASPAAARSRPPSSS